MTGARVPHGDGAEAEYVGIPGETARDAATAKEIASQIAAMPTGSFAPPDDPRDYVEDQRNEPRPEPGSVRDLRDKQPPKALTGDAIEIASYLAARESFDGLRQDIDRLTRVVFALQETIEKNASSDPGRKREEAYDMAVLMQTHAIEQGESLMKGQISFDDFVKAMKRAASKTSKGVALAAAHRKGSQSESDARLAPAIASQARSGMSRARVKLSNERTKIGLKPL